MPTFDALIRTGRKKKLIVAGGGTRQVDLGREAVERMVPHRAPFLFIDRVSAVNLDERAILGQRSIDPDDPVLQGHFPGDPVYPGVLLVETMAQLCICLQSLLAVGGLSGVMTGDPPAIRLLKVHHALFLAEVRPGDRLDVAAKMVEDTGYTAIMAGQVLRGDEICAMAILEAYLVEG